MEPGEERFFQLEQVEHALSRVQDAQQGLAGRLDVGYIKSVSATDTILPDILQAYRQRFPGIPIT